MIHQRLLSTKISRLIISYKAVGIVLKLTRDWFTHRCGGNFNEASKIADLLTVFKWLIFCMNLFSACIYTSMDCDVCCFNRSVVRHHPGHLGQPVGYNADSGEAQWDRMFRCRLHVLCCSSPSVPGKCALTYKDKKLCKL